MIYGKLPGIAKPISRLVQGCMMLKEGDEHRAWSFERLDEAVAIGINTFDHGHIYGGGQCQRVFGEWLAARGNREDVVILDKGCHTRGTQAVVKPEYITEELLADLERLGTDYVDLWLFHRDDPTYPVGPLIDCLNEHVAAGRIKAFGASNWSTARIAEANAYAAANGLVGFCCSSPNFSLAEQVDSPWGTDCVTISGPANVAECDWYRENGVAVFAWSSLARGFFSGRITRANWDSIKGDWEEHIDRCYATPDNFERLDRCEALGKSKGLTVAQIALAFVLNQPFDVYALVGAYNAQENASNLEAVTTKLTAQELAYLDLKADSPA